MRTRRSHPPWGGNHPKLAVADFDHVTLKGGRRPVGPLALQSLISIFLNPRTLTNVQYRSTMAASRPGSDMRVVLNAIAPTLHENNQHRQKLDDQPFHSLMFLVSLVCNDHFVGH
jgi:hypothetical protein